MFRFLTPWAAWAALVSAAAFECLWSTAAPAAAIACGHAEAAAGQTGLTLDLTLTAAPGEEVAGIQLELTFDPQTLSLGEAEAGPAALDAAKDVSLSILEPGRARIIIVGFNQLTFPDGILAYLRFSVAANAADGLYPVTPGGLLITDPYGVPVPATPLAGSIRVGEDSSESPDVNGDGRYDAVDIQLVINAVLGLGSDYDCDVNHDETVNAIDIQKVINRVLGL